jgi:DNA primase
VNSFIAEDLIEEIRERSDIVDIISQYVSLKKSGRNFKGLCPFHAEKTPSFMVSPEKQIFHCFGCGKGGNVFQFLVEYEDYSFPESVRFLASRLGITIPEKKVTKETSSSNREREELFQINQTAAKYFQNLLLDSSEGKKGRVYLKERGIEKASVKEFMIGYSSPSWEHLFQYFSVKGIAENVLEKVGLIIKSEKKKGYYDRFRGRVMFPIWNTKGDVIGFGGRTLESTDAAKYLNSPESIIFQKGKNLFGLNMAKEHIRKEDSVLITEGYFDVITAHQMGVKNTVATLGTALTKDHAYLLKRYTRNIYLVFDSDKAGESAVKRVDELLSQEMFRIYVISLPAGSDLDSFLRKEGKDRFVERRENAVPLVEYIIDITLKDRDLNNIEEKLDCISMIKPTISRLKNSIERNHYVSLLADKMRVSHQELLSELQKKDFYERKSEDRTEGPAKDSIVSRLEAEIVRLFLGDTAGLGKRINSIQDIILPSGFHDKRLAAIISSIYEAYKESREISLNKILEKLPDELSTMARKLTMEGERLYGDRDEGRWNQAMDDCIKKFIQKRKEILKRDIDLRMKQAERKGEISERDRLLQKVITLYKE